MKKKTDKTIALDPVILSMMIKLYQETILTQEVYIVGLKKDSPDLKEVLNFSKEMVIKAMQDELRDDCRYTFVVGNKKY
ncbi:MAG TPA: hypothetical protein VMY59_10010 [Candidatus Thermoplasmatota archaeon]|nr:hypothetical protein [Candidatus Thermoplasmatota archaeon]